MTANSPTIAPALNTCVPKRLSPIWNASKYTAPSAVFAARMARFCLAYIFASFCRPSSRTGSSSAAGIANHLLELFAGDGALIPGDLAVAGDDHGALVAFAGDQDDVAGAGLGEGQRHGGAAVHFDDVVAAVRAGFNLGDDLARVLGVRVFVGQDEEVGQAGSGRAHDRALGAIALAGAAENNEQPTARGFGQGAAFREDTLERIWRMRVVDQHAEGLAGVDALHA